MSNFKPGSTNRHLSGASCDQHSSSLEASEDAKAAGTEGLRFIRLLQAYRNRGGLSRQRDLSQRLTSRTSNSDRLLERWLEEGQLFCFEWQDDTWIPLFQLEQDLSPCPLAYRVSSELLGAFSGWQIAEWYVEPNCWLNGVAPVDKVITDPEAARQAARADRFIAQS